MLAYCFHDTKVKFNLSIGNSKLSHYSPFYTCRNCNHSTCKLFGLYKIFYWCKPVECIECQKNKRELNGFELCSMLFLSVCKSPTLSLTFHQTEISWFFNDISICCISFYVNFEKDEFFHVNLRFQKGKISRKCAFTTTAIFMKISHKLAAGYKEVSLFTHSQLLNGTASYVLAWESFELAWNSFWLNKINPFDLELPVTTCADPHPFYHLWRHQF